MSYDTPTTRTATTLSNQETTRSLSNEQTTPSPTEDSKVNDSIVLPIVVGVSVGSTVVLFLFIGVIISIVFFIVKVWIRDPYKKTNGMMLCIILTISYVLCL